MLEWVTTYMWVACPSKKPSHFKTRQSWSNTNGGPVHFLYLSFSVLFSCDTIFLVTGRLTVSCFKTDDKPKPSSADLALSHPLAWVVILIIVFFFFFCLFELKWISQPGHAPFFRNICAFTLHRHRGSMRSPSFQWWNTCLSQKYVALYRYRTAVASWLTCVWEPVESKWY